MYIYTCICTYIHIYVQLLCIISTEVAVLNIHEGYKNTNHQQMHKEGFIINRNTLLHVSTLLGHLQGELFVTVTLRLHYTFECEYAVDCVLRCFWRRELHVLTQL
jgi:hypothetical protein